MRKVIASLFLSLDGVAEAPQEWHLPYFNDEMGAAIGDAMATSDAFLLGRATYEEWADQATLELVDSKTFGSGVVYTTYRPAVN